MKQKSEENLLFTDNPIKARMIGIVLVSIATMLVVAMWRFGPDLFGADTLLLTVVRAVVGIVALLAFVMGFAMAQSPVRRVEFDGTARVLRITEKGLLRTTKTDVPFHEFAAVVEFTDELKNSEHHYCCLELADGETIAIPTPENVNAEIVAEMRRDIAVFVGLEKE